MFGFSVQLVNKKHWASTEKFVTRLDVQSVDQSTMVITLIIVGRHKSITKTVNLLS